MGIEMTREIISVEELIGENSIQAIIEGDILAPDKKPDINRIITISGHIELHRKEIKEDKVFVEGDLHFKVLYASEEGEGAIYSIDSSTDFRQEIEIPGLSPQMRARVRSQIEHIDYSLRNERKIGVRAIIQINGRGTEDRQIEVARDLRGIEDIELLQEDMAYSHIIAGKESKALVKESIDLDENFPEILEILEWKASVLEEGSKVGDGKLIVGGNLLVELLYTSGDEERPLDVLRRKIPFTHFVEIAGGHANMDYRVGMDVNQIYTSIKEDQEGLNRLLEIEGVVALEVEVIENRRQAVIVDAYSPSQELNLQQSSIWIRETLARHNFHLLLREDMELATGQDNFSRIISVVGRAIVTECNIVEERILIEGVLAVEILYSSDDQMRSIHSYKQEIPFRHYEELDGINSGAQMDIEAFVGELDYNKINHRQIEIRGDIVLKGDFYRSRLVDIVLDAEKTGEEVNLRERPSLTIYFFQEGDSLWQIAKKYHTSVEQIMENNAIEDIDNINIGDQIIIEKLYNFEF